MRSVLTATLLSLCLAFPRASPAEPLPAEEERERAYEERLAAERRDKRTGEVLATAWAGAAGATLWAGLRLAETEEEGSMMGLRLAGSSLLSSVPIFYDSLVLEGSTHGNHGDFYIVLGEFTIPPLVGLTTWGIGELTTGSQRPALACFGAIGGAAVGLAAMTTWTLLFGDVGQESEGAWMVMRLASIVLVNSAANIGYTLAGGGPSHR